MNTIHQEDTNYEGCDWRQARWKEKDQKETTNRHAHWLLFLRCSAFTVEYHWKYRADICPFSTHDYFVQTGVFVCAEHPSGLLAIDGEPRSVKKYIMSFGGCFLLPVSLFIAAPHMPTHSVYFTLRGWLYDVEFSCMFCVLPQSTLCTDKILFSFLKYFFVILSFRFAEVLYKTHTVQELGSLSPGKKWNNQSSILYSYILCYFIRYTSKFCSIQIHWREAEIIIWSSLFYWRSHKLTWATFKHLRDAMSRHTMITFRYSEGSLFRKIPYYKVRYNKGSWFRFHHKVRIPKVRYSEINIRFVIPKVHYSE